MKNGGGGEFSPPYFVKQEMGAVMERLIELLDRLDYQVPGLERAGQLYEKKDYEGCMEAVVEHFRTRTAPAYLFTVDDMKNFQDEKVLE